MDAATVSQIIADDLAAHPDFLDALGVDVHSCLVPPRKIRLKNSHKPDHLSLWLVLCERPSEKRGYLVVFDDDKHSFGLAVHGDEEPIFIGYYGSFTETLADM